jgi:hypothetical protein
MTSRNNLKKNSKNIMMSNLKTELESIIPQIMKSPWAGHEFVRGYGVFGLPLSSGHTFALRVFPINDFSPYVTLWHQTPDGLWTIYYDAVRPDIACPRYYGTATNQVIPASIKLDWISPSTLHVRIEKLNLEWTLWIEEPWWLHWINSISKRMPFWSWKYTLLLKPRQWMARGLGLGVIKLSGYMPSDHYGILMPKRMYFINRSSIRINGIDLGQPARVRPNPKIGNVPLPSRGIFSIGEAYWEIKDINEYNRTRAELEVDC